MTGDIDHTLVAQMQQGDHAAFRRVLSHFLGPLTGYALKMVRSASDAEDIVQETFIRLWNHRDRYNPERGSLATWLYRIAHNLCLDHLRRATRTEPSVSEQETAGPDRVMDDSLTRQALHEALMTLNERQRSAIVLTYYQGLPAKEVADILELTVDALESLVRRGRQKLQQELGDHT